MRGSSGEVQSYSPTRVRSDRAAKAAADWEALETAVETLTAELAAANARAEALEASGQHLQDELVRVNDLADATERALRAELDRVREENVRVRTTLNNVSTLMVDLHHSLRPPAPVAVAGDPAAAEAAGRAAVEGELE